MSQIVTFYSYKGGVGRTMALANVAVLLSKWGYDVLVIDWDLEAPGLEFFYKDYINVNEVRGTPGVIDLMQFDNKLLWQDCIVKINIPESKKAIDLITCGCFDEDYFKKVREFNVDTYYKKGGGDTIERLRDEWLDKYDYVLIDSRTGVTEIGGICTIQLPDTVVVLFTATSHGFEGVLDIIKRASDAQQKLPYDRQKLFFLPVPSKFETNTEFVLSQEWLDIFAKKLADTYDDWLPIEINKKDFLEQIKIPYIPYFSFGEKLPVVEQGTTDPSGLGFAYETLTALIAHDLKNVSSLVAKRPEYILDLTNSLSSKEHDLEISEAILSVNSKEIDEINITQHRQAKLQELEVSEKKKLTNISSQIKQPITRKKIKSQGKYQYDVFISYNTNDTRYAREIYHYLSKRGVSVFYPEISMSEAVGHSYQNEIDQALDSCQHLIVICSSREYLKSHWVEAEWGFFVAEKRSGRKNGNLLTIIAGDMTVADLPPSLRFYEVLRYGRDIFERIYQYSRTPEDYKEQNSIKIAAAEISRENKTMSKYRTLIFIIIMVSLLALIILYFLVSKYSVA